jgi:phenylpropionate dioxygenase-like ring-hydroxylating dioxygenase large terminal subunit
MLSKEDNEFLCRIGPGTPMGDVMRQYWMPAFQSFELPEPDCAPMRIRLLGENLIAFRSTSGPVGIIADNCPHRGASMFFGRNEEDGLRCVYHGWKFSTDGQCVDMPNEPPESNFKHKIRINAYKVEERNGMVWVYMGPNENPPGLPSIEWNMVPETQSFVSKRWQECNWVQALEGGIDNSHVSFLHSRLKVEQNVGYDKAADDQKAIMRSLLTDRHPVFEAVDTDYGTLIGARRTVDDQLYYWRVAQFLMPFYSMIASTAESPTVSGHAWVPVDDENTMTWSMTWHPTRELSQQERDTMNNYPTRSGIHMGKDGYEPATTVPYGAWRPKPNLRNDFLLDYDLQKTLQFCGIPHFGSQDSGVQETMGPIYDRTKEHLGTSDTGIIRVRLGWIKAAKELQESGTTPKGVENNDDYLVRAVAMTLPKTVSWVEGTAQRRVAQPGVTS